MRVLHIANFSLFKNETVFYSIDKKISNGFIKNGHYVAEISYRDLSKYFAPLKIKNLGIKKMQKTIFKTIDSLEPELVLFGHSELIDTNVVRTIKKKYPKLKLAMWWVDWLKNLSSIESKIDYLDVLFTTTSPKEMDEKLLKKNLTISYLPNICDSSVESYKAFDCQEFTQDLFFAGRLDSNREKFLKELKNRINSKIVFNLYGTSKEKLLLGNSFLKNIGQSKMSINLNRDHKKSLYSSDRLIQLMANGSLVISKSIPEINDLFKDDEIILFDDINQCKEKVEYYFYNDMYRKEIAYNGWSKAHSSYNSTRVVKFMIETIFKQEYSEKYEWLEHIIFCK